MRRTNIDLRAVKSKNTQEKIKHAFAELLIEKSFSKISVSDICKRLQINRGTFYLHYSDKYDLLKHCRDELIDGLYKIIGNTLDKTDHSFYFQYCDNNILPEIIKLFQFEKENAIYFKALCNDSFECLLEKRLHTKIIKHIECCHKEQLGNINLDYFIPCICSSLFTLTKLWLKNNLKPDAEEMAALYMKIYTAPTKILNDYQARYGSSENHTAFLT